MTPCTSQFCGCRTSMDLPDIPHAKGCNSSIASEASPVTLRPIVGMQCLGGATNAGISHADRMLVCLSTTKAQAQTSSYCWAAAISKIFRPISKRFREVTHRIDVILLKVWPGSPNTNSSRLRVASVTVGKGASVTAFSKEMGGRICAAACVSLQRPCSGLLFVIIRR